MSGYWSTTQVCISCRPRDTLPLCPRIGYKFQTTHVQVKASIRSQVVLIAVTYTGQALACAGHRAPAHSANVPVWQHFLDYGTVARELQATRSQSQPQSQSQSPRDIPAEGHTDTQHKHEKAAQPTAGCGEAASPGDKPQADHQLPSPVRSTSGQSAGSRPQPSKVQGPEPHSPSAGRHRADAAVTAAPARQSTSPPHLQGDAPSQAQDASATQQLPQPPSDLQQAEAGIEAGLSAEGDSASHRDFELETKLSELTHRLSAAERAAGGSSEIQRQLLQLKEDKAALQADLKQFIQHTSSMLTTIQAQMSRLMGCGTPSTAPVTAENSSTSGQLDRGYPEPALPAQARGCGSSEPVSPVTSAQARSSGYDWQLESRGSQPGPLARHEIFQTAATSPQHADHQAAHSRLQPGQSGSWMDELRINLDRRSTQVGTNIFVWIESIAPFLLCSKTDPLLVSITSLCLCFVANIRFSCQ